jgi:uncharacterized membrane protein HdeD (DUF308 family)
MKTMALAMFVGALLVCGGVAPAADEIGRAHV